MALIRNKHGRPDGGYTRLFGDSQLGGLISQVHSAVISSGNELEKLVTERANVIQDVDEFLGFDIYPDGVYVATKIAIKKSTIIDSVTSEPDFVVFERRGDSRKCHIIELKDGDAFDTKKAAGERDNMHRFVAVIAPVVQFSISVHFCCFNQNDRSAIVAGFKNRITTEEAMTGREFCALLDIDYNEVVEIREEYQSKNFQDFIEYLLAIESVRHEIQDQLAGRGRVAE